MNRQLCEAMGEEGSVTLGVGVIDLTNNRYSTPVRAIYRLMS